MNVALLVPDIHVPFHDKQCIESMFMAAQDVFKGATGKKEIIFLGDLADYYSVSSHGRHPEAVSLLIKEVDEVNAFLDTVDGLFPDIKKTLILGNHEFRLERYIMNNAPALFGVTSTEFLFQFNRRPNWNIVPYTKSQMYPVLGTDLYARHEPFSMSSAKASLNKCHVNLVYGHIHRKEEYWAVGLDGKQMVNFSCGWLGDERYNKVFGYAFPQWQKGFALVYSENGSKEFIHQMVGFDSKKRCLVNGKRY